MAKHKVIALYRGRVQGVGFRAKVRQLACGYDVRGTVRNLPDGRVELVSEGDKAELEAFLLGIAESELSGLIDQQVATWQVAEGKLRGFVILQ